MLSRPSQSSLVVPDVPAAKACFARINPPSLSQHAFAAGMSRTTGSAADGRDSMAPRASRLTGITARLSHPSEMPARPAHSFPVR